MLLFFFLEEKTKIKTKILVYKENYILLELFYWNYIIVRKGVKPALHRSVFWKIPDIASRILHASEFYPRLCKSRGIIERMDGI